MKIVPPGDDVCPTPPPVDEVPPLDRFCDLVLTGGLASGVVYPWAIVELARAYRFRNVGGTSVGAMAAALAAAAEYGRRTGYEAPFETLRRLPAALGHVLPDGRTRMFSLFQTGPRGRRLMELWGRLGTGRYIGGVRDPKGRQLLFIALRALAKVYAAPLRVGFLAGLTVTALALALPRVLGAPGAVFLVIPAVVAAVLSPILGALGALGAALLADFKQGVIENELGLCKGGTLEAPDKDGEPRPAICEWLHNGIQLSAGLSTTDRPLTFRDLWNAPAYPGAGPTHCTDADPPHRRAINLQMITTNVSHGRPYRLPLDDTASRLFFLPEELRPYLPKTVFDALVAVAPPYAPNSSSDPQAGEETMKYRQLPGADMPVLLAARLSLSFPFLFSAVPLYAVNYEIPDRAKRTLKRCLFTDGGVSSNFPIHLFDAALPRWPTFGLWLDRQNPHRPGQSVWLPEFQSQGWGDAWTRSDFVAATSADGPSSPRRFGMVAEFVLGLVTNTLEWRDRTSFRLPHVRNRVARLLLRPWEGGLHIRTPRNEILSMARRYGTAAGKLFVERFVERSGVESPAWREQRWVRLHLLVNGLRERLDGLSMSAVYAAYSVPMQDAITSATRETPLRGSDGHSKLSSDQSHSLAALIVELERLEGVLQAAVQQGYKPTPEPELRLRAPL